MRAKLHQSDRANVHSWHIGLSVLLAILILYNPFAAMCNSHGASEMHTLQRNRATVGSSELQHFSTIQDDRWQTDLGSEENREEIAVPPVDFLTRGFEREEEVPQPDLAPKVWSRPPPSL